jgi:hypothetical protein
VHKCSTYHVPQRQQDYNLKGEEGHGSEYGHVIKICNFVIFKGTMSSPLTGNIDNFNNVNVDPVSGGL